MLILCFLKLSKSEELTLIHSCRNLNLPFYAVLSRGVASHFVLLSPSHKEVLVEEEGDKNIKASQVNADL